MDNSAINMKHSAARPYQQCTHCVLDTLDEPSLQFDGNGVCSYCNWYRHNDPKILFNAKQRQEELDKIVTLLKSERKHPKYDCLLGVSGGVDSSYVALKLKELGLTPLLVHVDNGYNTELSNSNVKAITEHLGFDLHNYVIDWEEYRDVQLAFLRASVMDIEMVTDHAVAAYILNLADKMGVKYMVSGMNMTTEGILPITWHHPKSDLLNIRHIAWKFAGRRLRTLPRMSFLRRQWLMRVKGIKGVSILDYMEYDSTKAKEIIKEKLGWKDYGSKHSESIFTRFFQNYILPTKFHVDKRKAHFSTMICSGLMDRKTALAELSNPPGTPAEIQADKKFVLNKLGMSEEEFERIMKAPLRKHTDFPSYVTRHYRWEKQLATLLRPVTRLVKRSPSA